MPFNAPSDTFPGGAAYLHARADKYRPVSRVSTKTSLQFLPVALQDFFYREVD